MKKKKALAPAAPAAELAPAAAAAQELPAAAPTDDVRESNGNSEEGKIELVPTPELVMDEKRKPGVDGLSDIGFWKDQLKINIKNLWQRLLRDRGGAVEKATEDLIELLSWISGYQEIPEGFSPQEDIKAIRMEGGVPIVECSYHDPKKDPKGLLHTTGFGPRSKKLLYQFAARWMAVVDWNGYFQLENPADGHFFSKVEKNGELLCLRFKRSAEVAKPVELKPDADGNFTYVDRYNNEVTVNVADLRLKRIGVYTQDVRPVQDREGKMTGLAATLEINCSHHMERGRLRYHLMYLPNLEARMRLKSIVDNKTDAVERAALLRRYDEEHGRNKKFRKVGEVARFTGGKDRDRRRPNEEKRKNNPKHQAETV